MKRKKFLQQFTCMYMASNLSPKNHGDDIRRITRAGHKLAKESWKTFQEIPFRETPINNL